MTCPGEETHVVKSINDGTLHMSHHFDVDTMSMCMLTLTDTLNHSLSYSDHAVQCNSPVAGICGGRPGGGTGDEGQWEGNPGSATDQ